LTSQINRKEKQMNTVVAILLGILVLGLAVFAWLMVRFYLGRRKAAAIYVAMGAQKAGSAQLELGTVNQLSILPLVDFYAVEKPGGLETEAGVAYLVRAGARTILFDLGYNRLGQDEPLLLRNMQRLGIDPACVDFIVNSHPHIDHLSGSKWQAVAKRLAGKAFYSTIPLERPGLDNHTVLQPQILAPGVGTTGPLPVQLFLLGYTLEQSLVVDVAGKGLIVIVGCGHPGIEMILNRASQIFQRPIYGVIGGLHLLVKGDRSGMKLPMQKLLGSSDLPWRPTGEKGVYRAIERMKTEGVRLVSLSAHDSCEWTLETFQHSFGEYYRPLKVGQEISIESNPTGQPSAANL
jgi:7,8-dihydropterin-6-yl-methyl-4-(beta-D-ribofuranosyl)aminobenzene 5'-phosphate synthase